MLYFKFGQSDLLLLSDHCRRCEASLDIFCYKCFHTILYDENITLNNCLLYGFMQSMIVAGWGEQEQKYKQPEVSRVGYRGQLKGIKPRPETKKNDPEMLALLNDATHKISLILLC